MGIRIRRAAAEDLGAVRHIGLSTWPPTYGPLKGARYVDEALETYWSVEALQAAIDAGTIDLAETAQGVVGMAEVADLGEDMVMWKLYILPSQLLRAGGVRPDHSPVAGNRCCVGPLAVCSRSAMTSLDRVSSLRSNRGKHLDRVLAGLSDADVATLLAGGEPLGTRIGGSTARVHLEGEPLFVKSDRESSPGRTR